MTHQICIHHAVSCILFPLCIQAEISSEQISEAFYPIIFANYLSDPAKVAALIATPGGAGGGGGGGGGAGGGGGEGAAEEEKAEEVEEEAEIGGL